MNSLESHLARERMEPSVVMDALQKFNVISDRSEEHTSLFRSEKQTVRR